MELQDILKGEIQKLQGDSPASTNAEERTLKIKRLLAQDEGLPFEITSQEVFHAKGASETELAHLAKKCNLYIHHVLAVWAQLPEYDEHLLQQTRRDLFPLLVQLRKHTLPLGNLASLATILYHCQQGQYQLAVQSYMQLSIGNVAWPIGVNVVGIHSRSAQSRISTENTSNKEATVMTSDATRLWVTCVKRLITVLEQDEKLTAKT